MNTKRLRELASTFISENFPEADSSIIPDGVSVDAINNFVAYVRAKEKERRQLTVSVDSSPMIGLNPFKDSVAPKNADVRTGSSDFNTLLNDKSRE